MTGGLLAQAQDALRLRSLCQALRLFAQAEQSGCNKDECSAGRWSAYMLLGEFEHAWTESDALRARGADDPHRMWEGRLLAGRTVMVRCLHGFGDAVQFLRYIPLLRTIAASVTVQVPPRFVDLGACFDGVDDVITWGEDLVATEPVWEEQIEVMELPYLFRTKLDQLPIAINYLSLPHASGRVFPTSADCLQVGVVSESGAWNETRSVPLSLLKPLFRMSGCEFWNLNAAEYGAEHVGLRQDELCRSSIVGLAARIASLHLVITVDTLAAHLAGALGTPAWVMLQHEADWRWMHDRDDSPWYPSLRLFRQSTPGDWHVVIEAIGDALRAKLSAIQRGRFS